MTVCEGFSMQGLVIDEFENSDDFADAVHASCFIPGVTAFGLSTKFRGRLAWDGCATKGIPYKNKEAKKIFINVMPDKWPFIRETPPNTIFLNIYEPYNLNFPLDYWLWKTTWGDNMFLKGYMAGIKMRE
jgi:hypothetical protein